MTSAHQHQKEEQEEDGEQLLAAATTTTNANSGTISGHRGGTAPPAPAPSSAAAAASPSAAGAPSSPSSSSSPDDASWFTDVAQRVWSAGPLLMLMSAICFSLMDVCAKAAERRGNVHCAPPMCTGCSMIKPSQIAPHHHARASHSTRLFQRRPSTHHQNV